MSERYSKLFALSENLYATGSPVVIAAGALLKDNQSGKIIAQIKLRNIHRKAIKAAKVCIVPFDTVGCTLGDAVHYQYLDLSAARNEEFGQKIPIALPDAATRSFAATVEEIAFTDNSIWKATGEPWEVLPVPSSISKVYGLEFENQFKIEYGQNCKNLPLAEKDLWYCACGALNRVEEKNCHFCNKQFATISSYDVDDLNAKKDKRLAESKAQAEKHAAEAAVQAEKNKKMAVKIGMIAAVATVIVVAASFVATKIIIPSNNYKAAEAMLAEGDYDGAIKGFTALADYKDSADRVIEVKAAKQEAENAAAYAEAEAMLANQNFEGAIAAFEALDNYNNSNEMIDECKYQNAMFLMEQEDYTGAANIFYQILAYKDASEYFDDLYFVPAYIDIEKNAGSNEKFVISYHADGRMFDAYCSTSYSEKATVYKFDENGILIREDWESGMYNRYIVNDDETVSRYRKDNEEASYIFDKYGNITSFFYESDNQWKNYKGYEYDTDHNRCDHSTNYYGDEGTSMEGLLAFVQHQQGNLVIQSKIGYVCLYIPDGEVDMDLIWKNFRLMCGESIWY